MERSSEDFSFEQVGWVQGQGTTDELTTYDFVDPHVIEGINYYRLTQVDLNGKNTVVGTIALSYSSIA
ncbi:MAG: hypothetical protein DCO96_00180 [Fluviicola sp. XM-24bin1]|nr:MAG: hypothetical protein DCO96_00180 [Fluviicola sp. XM-24bin1]